MQSFVHHIGGNAGGAGGTHRDRMSNRRGPNGTATRAFPVMPEHGDLRRQLLVMNKTILEDKIRNNILSFEG